MPQGRWQQSPEGGGAAVEGVAAVEEEGVVEDPPTTPTTVPHLGPNTGGPNTLICRQGSGKGAKCTSNGGGGLFSVLSPPPAPGKMSSPPSQPNETGTSPRSLRNRMKTTV